MARLGEVCEIQLGKMLSPKSKTGNRSRPYLRNANVQWNRFDLTDVSVMDFSEAEEEKFALKYGDLLVCEGGEPGRAAVWREQIVPCYYQKALHRLRPIETLADSEFIMYRLWMGAQRGEFVESHAKTTIAHLPAVRLTQLPIGLPDIKEQRRIASILNERMQAIEQARAAAEEQLEASITLVRSYLRESLSSTPTKRMPLNVCLQEITAGVGVSWKNHPVIGATRAGLAPAKEPVGKKPERYKLVDERTIFYNPMRILLGSIAMVDEGDEPGITSPDYVVFKTMPGILHWRWFYYWFRSRTHP
jgi:type I restriction enzyme S subunit